MSSRSVRQERFYTWVNDKVSSPVLSEMYHSEEALSDFCVSNKLSDKRVFDITDSDTVNRLRAHLSTNRLFRNTFRKQSAVMLTLLLQYKHFLSENPSENLSENLQKENVDSVAEPSDAAVTPKAPEAAPAIAPAAPRAPAQTPVAPASTAQPRGAEKPAPKEGMSVIQSYRFLQYLISEKKSASEARRLIDAVQAVSPITQDKFGYESLFAVNDSAELIVVYLGLLSDNRFTELDEKYDRACSEAVSLYQAMLKGRHISDKPAEQASVSAPGQPDIIDLLKSKNLEYYDNRRRGGVLWLVGGQEQQPFVKLAQRYGYTFVYTQNGGRSTGYNPAWYLSITKTGTADAQPAAASVAPEIVKPKTAPAAIKMPAPEALKTPMAEKPQSLPHAPDGQLQGGFGGVVTTDLSQRIDYEHGVLKYLEIEGARYTGDGSWHGAYIWALNHLLKIRPLAFKFALDRLSVADTGSNTRKLDNNTAVRIDLSASSLFNQLRYAMALCGLPLQKAAVGYIPTNVPAGQPAAAPSEAAGATVETPAKAPDQIVPDTPSHKTEERQPVQPAQPAMEPALASLLSDELYAPLREALIGQGILTKEALIGMNLWVFMNDNNIYPITTRHTVYSHLHAAGVASGLVTVSAASPCAIVTKKAVYEGKTPAEALLKYCKALARRRSLNLRLLVGEKYKGSGPVVLHMKAKSSSDLRLDSPMAYIDAQLTGQAALDYAQWLSEICGDTEVNKPTEIRDSAPRTDATPADKDTVRNADQAPADKPENEPESETPSASSEDQRVLVMDYDRQENYAFTKPVSLTYQGQCRELGSWRSLYVDFCQLLYRENPEKMRRLCEMPSDSDTADIGRNLTDEAGRSSMLSPKAIAEGLYVETSLSATAIAGDIRRLLKYFDLSEKPVIRYRRLDEVGQTVSLPEEPAPEALTAQPEAEPVPEDNDTAQETPAEIPADAPQAPAETSPTLIMAYDRSEDYSYTRPVCLTYRGSRHEVDSWPALYVEFCKLLYQEDPQTMQRFVDMFAPSRKDMIFAREAHKVKMRAPQAFAEGLYVETHATASAIASRIKQLLGYFILSEQPVIQYRRLDDAVNKAPTGRNTPAAEPEAAKPADKQDYNQANNQIRTPEPAADAQGADKNAGQSVDQTPPQGEACAAPSDGPDLVMTFDRKENNPDYALTQPVCMIYKGRRLDETSWQNLYFDFCKLLSQDYPTMMRMFCDTPTDSGLGSYFTNQACIDRLRAPKLFAPDSYLESDISAADIAARMLANNEIGTIEPIQQLTETAHRHGVLFHTDAVQAVGHIPVDVKDLGVDMLSASAHKFNGPKGVGFLYIRKGVNAEPYLHGGSQESGMRAGTENVASIVGMAAALKEHHEHIDRDMTYLRSLAQTLITALDSESLDYILNGSDCRIPGSLSLSFKNAEGEILLHRLDLMGTAVSTGSACNSKATVLSHVIRAIGVPRQYAQGTIRVTLGAENTDEQMQLLARQISRILRP